MAMGRSLRVLHKAMNVAPYSLILENTRITDEFLLFESNVVASLSTEDCEEFKKQYSKLIDAYGCLGVLQLYGDRPLLFLVIVTACVSVGKIGDCDIYRITGVHFLPMWAALPTAATGYGDDRIIEIQKVISGGTFYFSWAPKEESFVDLSLCAQKRFKGYQSDSRFFWNRSLHLHLQRYGIDCSRWLLRVMCGGLEIKTVYVGHRTAKACIISRLSCERAGTRFNVRGTNDSGHVANFVETEQAIYLDDMVASFVQTRGSVPLFWEQPGVQVGSHKVKMSRGFEASAPAYDRHLRLIKEQYGDHVLVNLLSNREGEGLLSQAFKTHHDNSSHCDSVPFIHFDYHSLVRSTNKPQNLMILWNNIKSQVENFGFFLARGNQCENQILKDQAGCIRTNCLDCLDRTNSVQTFIGLNVLMLQLASLDLSGKVNYQSRFEEVFRQIWLQNGDHVSKIYAGTGALEFRSKLKDGARSVTRTIQNNLMDGSKQEAIDCFLLGSGLNTDLYDRASNLLPTTLLHACPNVLESVVLRYFEYGIRQTMRVFCGTWNVNGGLRISNVAFRNQSLADWLLDLPGKHSNQSISDLITDYAAPIDIFVIGLEEIVDLNATNIMSSSSANQKHWSEELKKAISRDHKYILITSVQLVGVCLFVYVRPHLAQYIRDVGTDVVKTGLGGATGNKGGVAIRFVLHATSFCFLCAHFAAGQSQVAERNMDYFEIVKKMRFPMGRNVFSHDYVFWVGDFNYRVDMPNDQVKRMIADQRWDMLLEAEQLTLNKNNGQVFIGFNEGPINFAPTYKYDTFSDDYDTSEKCRCPAWTDRILWWTRRPVGCELNSSVEESGHQCNLLFYGRSELKTSDHRPVGALFDIEVIEIDESKRDQVYHAVVACMGPPDATVLVSIADRKVGEGFMLELVDGILAKVQQLCIQVLLVKFVGDDMWLIFKDGEMALAALSMDGIGDTVITVRLRSPNWEDECAKELRQCRRESVAIYGNANYSLLSEDANEFNELEEAFDAEVGSLRLGDDPALHGASSPIPPIEPDLQQTAALVTNACIPPATTAPPRRPPPPRVAASTNVLSGSTQSAETRNLSVIQTADVQKLQQSGPESPTWDDFSRSRLIPDSRNAEFGMKSVEQTPSDPWSDVAQDSFVPQVPPRPKNYPLPPTIGAPAPPPIPARRAPAPSITNS